MNAPMHEEMLLDFPSLATSLVSVLITSHLGCCSHPQLGALLSTVLALVPAVAATRQVAPVCHFHDTVYCLNSC